MGAAQIITISFGFVWICLHVATILRKVVDLPDPAPPRMKKLSALPTTAFSAVAAEEDIQCVSFAQQIYVKANSAEKKTMMFSKRVASFPAIYPDSNSGARKRAKGGLGSSGWVDLTSYRDEMATEFGPHNGSQWLGAGGQMSYPNINSAQPMLESDNPIDTPTISPLVKTLLIKGGATAKIYKLGEVVAMTPTNKVGKHVNYRGMWYWMFAPNNAAADLVVLREGFELGAHEYRTVSVALQDACEVSGSLGWEDVTTGNALAADEFPVVGRTYAMSVTPNNPAGPSLTVTYLDIGPRGTPEKTSTVNGAPVLSDHTHWVCIHPSTKGRFYGVTEYNATDSGLFTTNVL
jgi:hypothetical protein